MSESDIEQRACSLIFKYLGIVGSKLTIAGETGYPDRVFWMPGGRPLLIEFKLPGEKPRPKQIHIHQQLRKLGYEVQTHDDPIDAFQAVIEAVDPARISKNSHKVLVRARRICAVLRSRAG